MKRMWKMAAAAAGVCVLAAGCGKGDNGGADAGTPAAGGPAQIHVAVYSGFGVQAALPKLAVSDKDLYPSTAGFPIEYGENGDVVFYADVNHDGKNERITAGLADYEANSEIGKVQVWDAASGQSVWEHEYAGVHPGYTMLYLYKEDGLDYLLEYDPVMYTGMADYSYRIFSLDKAGNPVTLRERQVEFRVKDNGIDTGGNGFAGNREDYVSFMESVDSYISKSLLIVSTDEGRLAYSTPRRPVVVYHKPILCSSYTMILYLSPI